MYFHYLKIFFLDQSIQKNILFYLETEALVMARASRTAFQAGIIVPMSDVPQRPTYTPTNVGYISTEALVHLDHFVTTIHQPNAYKAQRLDSHTSFRVLQTVVLRAVAIFIAWNKHSTRMSMLTYRLPGKIPGTLNADNFPCESSVFIHGSDVAIIWSVLSAQEDCNRSKIDFQPHRIFSLHKLSKCGIVFAFSPE